MRAQCRNAARETVAALLVTLLALSPTPSSASQETATREPARAAFGKLPLYFIENRGQLDARAAYYVQGSTTAVYFTKTGIVYGLTGMTEGTGAAGSEQATKRHAIHLDFEGASPDVKLSGRERTAALVSYFKGKPSEWKTALPTYAGVVYEELWPGIDLVYGGETGKLKYSFVIKPGADPRQIRLVYRGASGVRLTPVGRLAVETPVGGFEEEAPYAFQEEGKARTQIAAAFAEAPGTPDEGYRFGFRVGEYDPTKPLVLDPVVLLYCGYIGGTGNEVGSGIAVDASGAAYVAGYTASTQASFPVSVGPDLSFNGGTNDVFVAKVNAAGTALVYAGYIGGSGDDTSNAIAVDGSGNAYLTGTTTSTEVSFPVTVGPDLIYNGGTNDAWVAKVSAAGTALVYCGYIGGSSNDSGGGIALDPPGNAYVVGSTSSTTATFPVTGGPDLTYNGGTDAFVTKVNAAGTALVYGGYIGGSSYDEATAIAVDGTGNAFVVGYTLSTAASFPVAVGPDLTDNGPGDAFVAKVNAAGTALDYCGYIGGSGDEFANGVAVDGAGNAYVMGSTPSTEASFPVTGGPDLTYNGGPRDVFVTKVNAAGSGLVYSGYVGGLGDDFGNAITVDGAGAAYLTGSTSSTETSFPVANGPDLTYNGGTNDAFVAKVNAAGTALAYSGYIGGSASDSGNAIAVDASGSAYVVGTTGSTQAQGFPITVGPNLIHNGATDSFVARLSGPQALALYRSIGTAAPYGNGTAGVTNGSTSVNGTGTAWRTANRGRGDVFTTPCPDPPTCTGGVHYTVTAVVGEGALTITPAYSGSTNLTASYLIRRQHSTLSGWEDCINGPPGAACPFFPVASSSLVSDDRSEVGIAYKDTPFLLASDVLIQGSTTDATHTILLTADPGNRHNGVPGAGVVVDAQNGPQEFSIQDSNVTVEWLEFRGCRGAIGLNAVEIRADGGDVATNVLVQNLLVHDFDDATAGHDSSGIALSGDLISLKSVTIRNTMIWDGDNYGIEGDNSADSAIVENVSIDGMLNSGIWAGNSIFTVRNTIVTGSPTADFSRDTSGSLTGSHNTDSDGSGAVFFTNALTATAPAVFVVPNSNLHLKAGANSQVDSGLDLSSSFLNDVDGQSRSGLTWDRGADERDAPATATADLAIAKSDGQPTAVPGGSVTYTITVTNSGPDAVTGATVTDTLPASLVGASWTCAASAGSSCTLSGLGNILDTVTLLVGGTVTYTLTAGIDAFARGTLDNNVSVSPPASCTDTNSSNDATGDSDTLDPLMDVGVLKTDDVDPAALGGLLTYTLVVSNIGPSGATGVTLQDPLPADVSLETGGGAITTTQGTCGYTTATRTVDCTLGNIVPGTPVTVTIQVRPQALGTIVNTASVSHPNEPDSDSGNDSESETTTVEASTLGVRFMTVTSTDKRNVIEWVNPADADYLSTEILVRGDRFSNGPGDGFSLYNAGTAGARDKCVHLPGALSNGVTFYYAAFVHRATAPLVSPGHFVTGRPFAHVPGPVKWAFSTGASALAAPTVGGTGVIATSNDHVVYSMERGIDDDHVGVDSGEWPASFRPVALGGPAQQRSPVVPVTVGTANPVVYMGAQDGKVYVVDAAQGGTVGFPWPPAALGPMVQAAPAGIFGAFGGSLDYLVVGTRNSTTPNAFVALDPYTGAEIERFDNGGAGPGEIGIVNGMAALDYGPPPRAYFTNYERTPVGSTLTLRCFELNAAPGVWTQLWARALGNIDSSPVLRNGRVYVGSPLGGGTLYSIDAATGNNTLDRVFVHGNGQVKGFVFPDRGSNDLYFATDNSVWGVTDSGAPTMTDKYGGPINLPGGATPSPVLFTPGSHYVYVGGSDGSLYEIDTLVGTAAKSVPLGDGLAVVGAPSLDRGFNLVHVGTVAGIFYAVQVPLP